MLLYVLCSAGVHIVAVLPLVAAFSMSLAELCASTFIAMPAESAATASPARPKPRYFISGERGGGTRRGGGFCTMGGFSTTGGFSTPGGFSTTGGLASGGPSTGGLTTVDRS